MTLTPAQRARVDELFDELVDLPESARSERLLASTDDPAIRQEVESLARAARAASGFLSAPASIPVDPVADGLAIDSQLGAWRVTGLLGRGGMGDVYEARRAEGGFEQRAAIKVLQLQATAQKERFEAERQILARLEHPGIARLHDGGITGDGRPYMVMEYVRGQPITEYCERVHAGLEQRLQLFLQVCDAIAYAHRNLVIHRDLKPSNILVTDDGQVKVVDFGIAKLLDASRASLTVAAVAPMTLRCAAPEQLAGAPITTATDVYALGVLLFELLTGAHPWLTADTPVLQALRTALSRPPPVASHTAAATAGAPVPAAAIRGDLDAIVAKALREEPAQRYPTVDALRKDVVHVVRGEPVEAREGARLYLLGRALRRYRWGAAAVLSVFLSLSIGLGLAAWQARRAGIERDTAQRDAAREEAVRYHLTRLFRNAMADQGTQPTAKGMIDNSAQRVLREYHDRPELAGQLVLTLADLYGALEDVSGAGALLEGFVAQPGAGADPAALADARQKLANIELLRGHVERATILLDQAQSYWDNEPRRFAEERLEALAVRARVQRAGGDLDGSIATSRAAIAARLALSGHDHRETAVLFNSLAISLAAANRLDEALDAYRETTRIYRSIGLGDGLDAQIVLGNTGTLELRVGNLREAEELLRTAIEHERALAGNSAAVAAAMGYYGRVLSVTNRNELAIPALREAVELGAHYAGATSPVTLQNTLFLGNAQAAAGNTEGAQATLAAARDAARRQYGPNHVLTLRIQLALAQLTSAKGQVGEARHQLSDTIAALRSLGPSVRTNLAQALLALGEVDLSQGKFDSAVAELQEALAVREQTHDRSWETDLTRERFGEALERVHREGAGGILRTAEHNLEIQLGTSHPETLRAKRALTELPS